MKSAIYVRVSTKDQSVDLQVEKLTAYCASRGWSYVIYSDNMSGALVERPELQKMLTAARRREIDVIVCWKLDRLFRSLRHLVATLQELTDLGVQFVCVQDQIDLTTASGRFMTHLLAAFSEFEREIIAERIRAGVRRKIAQTGKWGRSAKIDPVKAKALYARYKSMHKVAKVLHCSPSTVHKALKTA